MTTTHPVDSTLYRCCNAIGQHGPDCTTENLSDRDATMPGMNTTPAVTTIHSRDGYTGTWRDLADQLTPEQVAKMESWEREGDKPLTIRIIAEKAAQENTLAREYARVPLPADATGAAGWEGEPPSRYFSGTERGNLLRVGIAGFQWPDGRTERHVWVSNKDGQVMGDLTPDEAREYAAGLVAAADELERLSDAGDAVRT